MADPAILILAPDVARDTYGVPALAGRASATPQIVDCLTRHRLKAGLHTFQNESCCLSWFAIDTTTRKIAHLHISQR